MLKTKILILLTVFIDVIGVGIVIPILPFYITRFTDSSFVMTSILAIYAVCSFFSAPLIGSLSDKIGRKPMLITSIFSTALGWFIFAGAPNIFFVFLGRIIDGIMAGNFPIAQSYLSDIAKDDKERTTNLGLIGAVFGIGFIIGPLLGGLLGHLGHTIPFWFVGTLALFNAILGIFTLPETHKVQEQKKIKLNPFLPIVTALKNTDARSSYIAWFLFGLAVAGYQSIFSLYLKDIFNFTEFSGGLLFGLVGVIIVINQAFAMKKIWLRYFKEPVLELNMLIAFVIGFILLSIKNFPIFIIGIILTTFAQSILRVVMTSQVVGFTTKDKRGETLGVMASITSLSMAISPMIAGYIYDKHHVIPFIMSSIYLLIAYSILKNNKKQLEKEILPIDIQMESAI